MSRVGGIESENFKEYIKQLDEFSQKNDVFATQTNLDGNYRDKTKFYAVIWYNVKEQEKPRQEPQKQENKPINNDNSSKPVEPITPDQYKKMIMMSKDPEGEEYLKYKGIKSEKDIEKLSKKEAWKIINEWGY